MVVVPNNGDSDDGITRVDDDEDVDLADFAQFQAAYSGS